MTPGDCFLLIHSAWVLSSDAESNECLRKAQIKKKKKKEKKKDCLSLYVWIIIQASSPNKTK